MSHISDLQRLYSIAYGVSPFVNGMNGTTRRAFYAEALLDIPTKFMVLLAHHLSYHVFSTLSDTKLN
jgi:hypothetical protein